MLSRTHCSTIWKVYRIPLRNVFFLFYIHTYASFKVKCSCEKWCYAAFLSTALWCVMCSTRSVISQESWCFPELSGCLFGVFLCDRSGMLVSALVCFEWSVMRVGWEADRGHVWTTRSLCSPMHNKESPSLCSLWTPTMYVDAAILQGKHTRLSVPTYTAVTASFGPFFEPVVCWNGNMNA